MKKYILAAAAAVAMGFGFTGCSDQLDIPQKGVYPTESYYSTDEEAATALALSMAYINNMAFEVIESINCLSDDMWPGGANSGDQPGLHQFSGFYISTENDKVYNIYSFSYRLIYFSNVLIEALENKEDATPFMKQCVAEAYFLRGWAEFYLAALWGNPPVVTHVLQPSEYGDVYNSADGEMMAQAEADFQKAISIGLPKKAALGDKSNLAHCTEGAALGYLGKVQLFQKKYAEAATTYDKIINSGVYALYEGDYENIIKAPSNWSDEGIFEINCPPNQGDVTAVPLMSYVYIYAGWREDYFDFTTLDQNVWGNFNTTGYGFFNPQGKLVDALIKSDGIDGYRTTSVVKDQKFVEEVMNVAKKPNAPAHGHGLYCGWKNRYEWSDVSMNWGGWSPFPATNFRYMRYAEVLLRAAEAHLNGGSGGAAKALQYVNEVRRRAKAQEYTSIDMDKIKLECQVELCMEGQRFMDLVRWGDAYDELKDQGKNIEQLDIDANGKWILTPDAASNPSYGFQKGRNELLPYPKQEMDQNPNIVQNPGY
ncbi:MAG: RagB/SusD family nutrient uptake outer membrane protein [Bacteroidales bacterium]|nr:RagB/SusD family nutrient uptake outer membrane protein [Bacteroidales bacterium]